MRAGDAERNLLRAKLSIPVALLLCGTLSVLAQQPVRLEPQFTPGQSLVYQTDIRIVRDGGTEGVIEDPHAARHVATSLGAQLRLDVLAVVRDPNGRLQQVRLRARYEQLAVSTESDVPDPQIADREEQLRRLEGRALEFTLDAEGQVHDVVGLEDVLPEQSQAVREWLTQMRLRVAHPRTGIRVGQSWEEEDAQPVSVPLAGYVRRLRSTYLRNEPCSAGTPTTPVALAEEPCAVILTRLELVRRRAPADPTPEEFRRRGLRTAGVMSGGGETLSYVSLRTGLLVSATQASREHFDLTVSSEVGQQARYRARLETQAQISLLALHEPAAP